MMLREQFLYANLGLKDNLGHGHGHDHGHGHAHDHGHGHGHDHDHDHDQNENQNQNGLPSSLSASSPLNLNLDLVRDITERSSTTSDSPTTPLDLTLSRTGFPVHTRRARGSVFKQQRAKHTSSSQDSHSAHGLFIPPRFKAVRSDILKNDQINPRPGSEMHEIDRENTRLLAQMSPSQIEQERAELMAGLSSSLIESLLTKANIEDYGVTEGIGVDAMRSTSDATSDIDNPSSAIKSLPENVTFGIAREDKNEGILHLPSSMVESDAIPAIPPSNLYPVSSQPPLPSPVKLHFTQESSFPSLDPLDPNFLDQLHSNYFPDSSIDPSKMAWMAPIPSEASPADRDSPYNPLQEYLHPSSIRFDFKGRLIPPRLARQIPATKGLHHHGLAPEAAGYTIPELAHLSRSAVPAQRYIAYQTLGRILYRLGRGDFGKESDELYLGLWKCVEEGRVLDTLSLEAEVKEGQGNRTCKVTASEAIWLWKKGGGKRQKAA